MSKRQGEGPSKPPDKDTGPQGGAEFMDVSRVHAAIMREKDEPADGYEPVPAVWLAAVIVLAMWGGSYLGAYNMGFRADALDGSQVVAVGDAGGQPAKPVDPMVLGKRVFNSCMACHQASGTGIAGQFPPLAQSEWVTGDEGVLVRILLQGLEGPIDVLGKPYDGAMPAWGSKLSNEQIAAVLTYIRAAWDNQAAAVSPHVVDEVRAAVGKRERAWSAAELLAVSGRK